MDIPGPIITLLESATGQGRESQRLTKGSVVQARILASNVPGRVELQIGDRILQAVMSRYLEPGSAVQVRVLATQPRLVLALDEEEPQSRQAPGRPAPSPSPLPDPAAKAGDLGDVRSDRAEIQARVLEPPVGNKLRLQITVPPPALRKAGPDYAPKRQPLLAMGREISARLAGDTKILATMKPGQELRFEVARTLPGLVLRAVGPAAPSPAQAPAAGGDLVQKTAAFLARPDAVPAQAAETLAALDRVADMPPGTQNRIVALMAAIKALSPKAGEPDREFLSRLIEHFGLEPETGKIRSAISRLFVELLETADKIPEKLEHPSLKAVLESVGRLHEAMDRISTLNHETLPRDQTVHFAFPFFWPGDEGRGELRLTLPEKDRDKPGGTPLRLSFLLFMSRMGRVRVDLEMQGRHLNGTIWTQTAQARDAVRALLPELVDPLTGLGFDDPAVQVRTLPPDKRPPESLAEELAPASKGLLDVKV